MREAKRAKLTRQSRRDMSSQPYITDPQIVRTPQSDPLHPLLGISPAPPPMERV